jgi:hydrogenase maturation protease
VQCGEDTLVGGEGGKGGEALGDTAGEHTLRGGHRSLVIGLGNPLRGDDGVGPEVIHSLRRRRLDGLQLVESDGHDLVEWLAAEGFDQVVIIDAADLALMPGSWVRLTPEVLGATPLGLTHEIGLVEALGLLEAIRIRPAPIVIFAVQPAAIGWGPGLSRAVRRAVPAVASAIRRELLQPRPGPGTKEGAGMEAGKAGGRTVFPTDQDVRSLLCGAKTA